MGPVASYCDYESGSTADNMHTDYYQYTTGNIQEKCNSRMLRSLKVLNANYAPAAIQFVLHSDYPDMLHATVPGFDGFFERATGGTADFPNANDLKERYNIPKALNISPNSYSIIHVMCTASRTGFFTASRTFLSSKKVPAGAATQ